MSDTKTPRTDARMDELMREPIEHRAMAMAAWAMQLERDLAAAVARAEAAEADAGRYRWLRDNKAYVAVQPHYKELPITARTGWTIRLVSGDDDNMDAAIDAALQESGNGS